MKLNKNKKELKNEQTETLLFDVYEDFLKLKQDSALVSYDQLIASVLFKNNLGFNSKVYEVFYNSHTKAIENKHELVFDSFVITFNINPKFSLNKLVPMLAKTQSSNSHGINLKNANDQIMNQFLVDYNQNINQLIAKNHIVEVLPNIIIFNSLETKTTKLFFDASVVVETKPTQE